MVNNICPSRKYALKNDNEKEIYSNFVKAVVERYDWDDDFGCTQKSPDCYYVWDNEYPNQKLIDRMEVNPVKYWQVCNQFYDTCEWKECSDNYAEKYAEVQEITYKAIKESDSSAKVLIAGDSSIEEYSDVLKLLDWNYIDIIDFHRYGQVVDFSPKEDFDFIKEELKSANFDISKLEFWTTETGTYSGNPGADRLTYQNEGEQAQWLVKFYISGVWYWLDKLFWARSILEWFWCECCIFDYTGLVYDGDRESQRCDDNDSYDLGFWIKKLAYYSYKYMIQRLEGIDWDNVKTIREKDGIYVYEFINKKTNKSTWVAWVESGSASIYLNYLGIASANIVNSVPNYVNGKEIIDANVSFLDMFKESIVTNDSIQLSETPIYIEER